MEVEVPRMHRRIAVELRSRLLPEGQNVPQRLTRQGSTADAEVQLLLDQAVALKEQDDRWFSALNGNGTFSIIVLSQTYGGNRILDAERRKLRTIAVQPEFQPLQLSLEEMLAREQVCVRRCVR